MRIKPWILLLAIILPGFTSAQAGPRAYRDRRHRGLSRHPHRWL